MTSKISISHDGEDERRFRRLEFFRVKVIDKFIVKNHGSLSFFMRVCSYSLNENTQTLEPELTIIISWCLQLIDSRDLLALSHDCEVWIWTHKTVISRNLTNRIGKFSVCSPHYMNFSWENMYCNAWLSTLSSGRLPQIEGFRCKHGSPRGF